MALAFLSEAESPSLFRVPACHATLFGAFPCRQERAFGDLRQYCKVNQGNAQAHEQKLKETSLLSGLTLDVLQIILPGTVDLKGGERSEHHRLSLIDICLEVIPAALHR